MLVRIESTARSLCFVLSLPGCVAVADLGAPRQLESVDGGVGDAAEQPHAIALGVGPDQSCAVIEVSPSNPENRSVRCWGSNAQGQLGADPASTALSFTPLPVAARPSTAQSDFVALALGQGYSCAITADGYLLCWGLVPSGLGVQREQDTPVYEPSTMDLYSSSSPLTQVTSASVDADGGCCTSNQSLVCWGDVKSAADHVIDASVAVAESFDQVAIGRAHACGIGTRDGVTDVFCWGADERGQAGQPFTSVISVPAATGLAARAAAVQIAAGGDESCALLADGSVYCWGANDSGQLGSAGPDSSAPVRVVFPTGEAPSEIAVGDAHACALITPNVWCWGDNSASQLGGGPGGPSFVSSPAKVLRASSELMTVQDLAAGGRTTCATLFTDPRVHCWGANESGQAGQDPSMATVPWATPVAW